MILVLAVPPRVGVGDVQAECFEFGQEGPEAALVVEPGLVVGELVVGEQPGDGFAGDFAGPLVVGAVQGGRVGMAAAVRAAAAGHPLGHGAGEDEADRG
jgi:hypothetical protein